MKGKSGSGRGWMLLGTKRDGRFVLKYRVEEERDGKVVLTWKQHRVERSVQTKRDAEAYASVFVAEQATRAASPQTTRDAPSLSREPILADFSERWLALRREAVGSRDLRMATHRQDVSVWRCHIAPALGTVPLRRLLDGDDIIEWLTAKKLTHANLTVRNMACTLKVLFDDIDAERWFPIPKNPMRSKRVKRALPKPRTRAGKKVKIHVPLEDLRKLFACRAVQPFNKLCYLIGLATGVRDGELFGLRWRHVVLDAPFPVVQLRRALALVTLDGPNKLQDLKTDDSQRDVPLHPVVLEALRHWKEHGWVQWVGREPRPDDFLLPNASGKSWRPKSAKRLREDLVRAGASPTFEGHNVTVHALRRNFSTWLDSFPEAHLVKKDLMGHSDKDTDRSHYAAVSVERKQRAVNSLPLPVAVEDLTNPGVGTGGRRRPSR